MSDAEAIADVVTGGVIARAVGAPAPASSAPASSAPASSEGASSEHARDCLNCGTGLTGDYCHTCGQAAHVHRTLGAFWHDFLHGVLHFEGKVWRTLPMLAWHPGALTRRYVAGERARFVSPLALFLFCVFLTFAAIGWTGGPLTIADKDSGLSLQQSLDKAMPQIEADILAVERERVAAIAAGKPIAAIDARLKDKRDEASMLRMMKERGLTETALVRASDDLPDAPDWINAAYVKAKANPSLLLYKLQNNAYKYSWALIPISVPFMWLLFPFSRRFRMYDHAVFVTYSLCFMTLLVVVASIARAAGGPKPLTGILLGIIPIAHIYRQLRGAYGLGRLSAVLRTALLLVFCVVTSVLFVLLLVALGVLG